MEGVSSWKDRRGTDERAEIQKEDSILSSTKSI
jgi:hypothetical protein